MMRVNRKLLFHCYTQSRIPHISYRAYANAVACRLPTVGQGCQFINSLKLLVLNKREAIAAKLELVPSSQAKIRELSTKVHHVVIILPRFSLIWSTRGSA